MVTEKETSKVTKISAKRGNGYVIPKDIVVKCIQIMWINFVTSPTDDGNQW